MVYVGEENIGLLKAAAPLILNVPLAIVRKPSVLAPCTVTVPPGKKSSTGVALVPLLTVTPPADFRLRIEVLPKAALVAPVKVMPTCEVSAFWLKFIVPKLLRLPPTDSVWVATAPAGLAWNVPPVATAMVP